MNKRRAGIALLVIGAVLILSALLLFAYNKYEDYRAGQEAKLLMDDIQYAISDENLETNGETDLVDVDEPLSPEMPTLVIDGYEYIGYLSIPSLELELPVMAEWDYPRLKIAPCRHFGSSRTDDLVIAAHNFKNHFGSLSELSVGTEITFVDMDGIENRYSLVKEPDILSPDSIDAVQNSGHDLVLYTCTPGGAARVVAFCDRESNEIGNKP